MFRNLHVQLPDGRVGVVRSLATLTNTCSVELGAHLGPSLLYTRCTV